MNRPRLMLMLLLALGIWLTACGTAAEARPTFEATNTALPRAANLVPTEEAEESEEAAPVAENDADGQAPAVAQAATATPLPPTATPTSLPPTATPAPVETEAPTAIPATATPETAQVVYNGLVGLPEEGEFWFNGGITVNYQGTDWQCSTCHQVAEPIPGSGPYLYGIGKAAADHAPEGLDATGYLVASILRPNEHLAPNQVGPDGTEYVWAENVMPTNWGTVMDDQIVADLVAYLLSLTQDGAHEHSN
jgi:hypothetical protein